MKLQLQASEQTTFKKRRKLLPTLIIRTLTTTSLLLTLIIVLYFPFSHYKPIFSSQIGFRDLQKPKLQRKNHTEPAKDHKIIVHKIDRKTPSDAHHKDPKSKNIEERPNKEIGCDIFTGEWVRDENRPYYTNKTCHMIEEHQNCMKFGRPDSDFLKWRWKPDDCELTLFDPLKFLEMVKGKSLAFIGDSVARNHMQSLICLLSRVAHPMDLSRDPTAENRLYTYPTHDFNITIISSPYLVATGRTDPNDVTRPYHLYLDEPDPAWTARIHTFDYLIISAGQWFLRPTYFYLNRAVVGCLYCPEPNLTHHATSSFSYRRAFRTTLQAIGDADNGFNGSTFLRTFVPSHFEGGPWDKGGDCVRTGPFKRDEAALEGYVSEMYQIQVEELGIARRRSGGERRFRLFDATKAMALRPDGHPSKYGHWSVGPNQTIPNDCVHWCLPGPIDAWNDMLQELLRRETKMSKLG